VRNAVKTKKTIRTETSITMNLRSLKTLPSAIIEPSGMRRKEVNSVMFVNQFGFSNGNAAFAP
jgi:hypothetical protein